ncbi:RNA polymerase-binding protein DksA [Microvenator marinus]|jgi:DnaK suppressor protein|uniref:RNA polymerase-binding protein DksA n=1 Tax=Microvenator marinus TaxID=2600177 RepID=A0A5B8Y0G8_9DELT|nr:TraR/DksA C4-type zinc finger protein [Microvenator marinus]QED29833.1 RNA polymerase-binding protein DksA [Microvenator marinus]
MAKKSTEKVVHDELTEEDLEHFKQRLLQEREDMLAKLNRHLNEAMVDNERPADELDQAGRISDQAYLMRLADKEQKLIKQIDRALAKFESGEFGLCEGTGEPISRKRLEVRPWTRYSIEYKEQLEREMGKSRRL